MLKIQITNQADKSKPEERSYEKRYTSRLSFIDVKLTDGAIVKMRSTYGKDGDTLSFGYLIPARIQLGRAVILV